MAPRPGFSPREFVKDFLRSSDTYTQRRLGERATFRPRLNIFESSGARVQAFERNGMESALLERDQTATVKSDDRGGKYLVFQLGREEFGIRVLKVREIMGIQDITAVPQTPAHVKGVINLRGKVIPVVDLRLKFGLPELEYTQRTCIIVVQVRGEDGLMLTGIVVDGVAEVLNLAAADIEDTPEFGD